MSRGARASLRVKIISAANLRPADTSLFGSGKSDPYVKVEIPERPYLGFKTSVQKKTLEPTWNHEATIECFHPGDILKFLVFDHDIGDRSDSLGNASLQYREILPNGFSGDLTLSDAGKKSEGKATLTVKVTPIQNEPTPEDATRCFVSIISGSDLSHSTDGSALKLYAMFQVPRKPASRCMTRVINGTPNPEWDEEGELLGYEPGDTIDFLIVDHRKGSDGKKLGRGTLQSDEFYPDGYEGDVSLGSDGTLSVAVDIVVPVTSRAGPVDPGEHIGPLDLSPVPFRLRSAETGREHQLMAFTRIGRSTTKLDPSIDLVLSGPGTEDISREHAIIKAWQPPDSTVWCVRVYPTHTVGIEARGYGYGPGGGHTCGGTSVFGVQADPEIGTEISPGSVIRFGVNELWALEKAALFTRSQEAAMAMMKATAMDQVDPTEVRCLRVPNVAAFHALQGCTTWFDLMRVVLELLGEPDEPPCVEAVEVQDELGAPVSRHVAQSLEEQEGYDVKLILKEVRIGTTIRLKLCSDARLLAPILDHLERHRRTMEKHFRERGQIPE